jgi:hypothetical protein
MFIMLMKGEGLLAILAFHGPLGLLGLLLHLDGVPLLLGSDPLLFDSILLPFGDQDVKCLDYSFEGSILLVVIFGENFA